MVTSLLADTHNEFNAFIDKEIKNEATLLDQNLSLDDKVKLKKGQESDYRDFFLQYTTDKKKNLAQKNLYHDEINRLTIRMNTNRYAGNTNAVKRDKLLLKNYTTRNALREMLNSALTESNSESKKFFKEKLDEIVEKYFSTYKSLDKSKYISSDQNQSTPLIQSIHLAFKDQIYLEQVANTFSSELIKNRSFIYHTSSIADSRYLHIINEINISSFGQEINTFILPFGLDLAKIILVLSMIIFIYLLHHIMNFFVDRILQYKKIKEDDIEYIHKHIMNIVTMITTLAVMHFTLVIFLDFSAKTINITKLFLSLYVMLITLLLYRITNTIAYLKIEQMKNSELLRNEVVNLTIKVIQGIIILIALIALLKIFGVDLTALLSGLGIAGAAVAFAAKDSIANIFGSISILFGDVFKQGDWIETKDVNGTVVEIGLRATTIRTFDNALISIPNFNLSDTAVTNWSRRTVGRRIKMSVGVTYESDFGDIRKAIDDIRDMLMNNPDIAQKTTSGYHADRRARLVSQEDYRGIKNTTLVYMDEFADSSINILIYCFSRTVDWNEWLRVKEDTMYKIEDIITQNNLEFAYPTMMLHQARLEQENMEKKITRGEIK